MCQNALHIWTALKTMGLSWGSPRLTRCHRRGAMAGGSPEYSDDRRHLPWSWERSRPGYGSRCAAPPPLMVTVGDVDLVETAPVRPV